MQNKVFRFGPIALTTTLTTDILKPPTATGGTNAGSSANYIILNKITIVNKTDSAATFSLWIGASGGNVAGTEFLGTGRSVAARGSFEYNGRTRLASTDVIVGGAGTATALTITGEGEIGVEG